MGKRVAFTTKSGERVSFTAKGGKSKSKKGRGRGKRSRNPPPAHNPKGKKKRKKTKAKKQKRRGNPVAKKKKRASRTQSVGSWAGSVVGLVVGLSNVAVRAFESAQIADASGVIDHFPRAMVQDFTGFNMPDWSFGNGWSFRNLARGWLPPIAGVGAKVAISQVTRRARVKTLFPAV